MDNQIKTKLPVSKTEITLKKWITQIERNKINSEINEALGGKITGTGPEDIQIDESLDVIKSTQDVHKAYMKRFVVDVDGYTGTPGEQLNKAYEELPEKDITAILVMIAPEMVKPVIDDIRQTVAAGEPHPLGDYVGLVG